MANIDFTTLNEKLEKICEQLEILVQEKQPITEMAEKQGFDKYFTYYTLDNEYSSHYPHVHVCVPTADKSWDGKTLRSGNPLKSVASIKLDRVDGYTVDNLEFEEIKDKKITGNTYKKEICNWLNSNFNGKRTNKDTNAYRCLDSYIMNNENGTHNDQAEELLD